MRAVGSGWQWHEQLTSETQAETPVPLFTLAHRLETITFLGARCAKLGP